MVTEANFRIIGFYYLFFDFWRPTPSVFKHKLFRHLFIDFDLV